MDGFNEFLFKLRLPTEALTAEAVQDILLKLQHIKNKPIQKNIACCNEIVDCLWMHMRGDTENLDIKLLCAITFYTILSLGDKQDFYLKEILIKLEGEIDENDHCTMSHIITLSYGMFQSKFLLNIDEKDVTIRAILNRIFILLIKFGYNYSCYTFLVFKIINSFKIILNTNMESFIFSEENQIQLLNLVNHNWENPITGIRDLNKTIFHSLVSIMHQSMYLSVVNEINSFYWNKAKYLMLSEIIACQHTDIDILLRKTDWIDGLIISLHKPGLVSAGADMYFAILKRIRSDQDWCSVFLKPILGELNGPVHKSIENFTNYWCLTTFKRFPSLFRLILEELKLSSDTKNNLTSILSIMKQGNKLALLEKNWDTNECEFLKNALESCNIQDRIIAFDVACVLHGKDMPRTIEYNLVYNYLFNNMNSDSTVLRINMLGSLKSFLIRLHMNYINNSKNSKLEVKDEGLKNFVLQIQELILTSIKTDGNYQRKITSIKLCDTIITYFSGVPRKKLQQISPSHLSLLETLKQNGLWILSSEEFIVKLMSLLQDPADDVRENVGQILYRHYFEYLTNTYLFNKLIENALKSMKSKFFYEISCGQSMFKLVLKILIKERQSQAEFKTVENIVNFFCTELNSEYKLNKDIMESIETGKQLHSFIGILHAVMDVSLQNSYKIKDFDKPVILELLDTLEGISSQFAWEEEETTSSDFSKISDMVQQMIMKYGYNPSDEKDKTKISGLHQIVLNCLWLNVKSCCELSSLILRYHSDESDLDVCGKCLWIITHVLETSRHKGAIEAAGAALGNCIQYLTSLPKGSELSKLPYTLLKSKLNELISEAGGMASVTRRGAGLSIMVHRIVASDMNKGKPLFHHFMKTLLEVCNKTADVPSGFESDHDIDNEKDLPKAIYIHFLTRIVIDSSLASDIMYYSASLAQIAFSNLTSNCWQIRNAALQLYGALVPKLIGQKKSSGVNEETIATVACDEFRTHFPQLWLYILNQLSSEDSADKVQTHSDLVPILNILANSAKRYNFSCDSEKQTKLDCELFKSLIILLGSPIYTVRRLTANCIYNIFPFDTAYSAIKNQVFVSENTLHGSLMLIGLYDPHDERKSKFNELNFMFTNIMTTRKHSYLCKVLYENISTDSKVDSVKIIKETLVILETNRHEPGINNWANLRVQRYIAESNLEDVPKILKSILYYHNSEDYCQYIHNKLMNDRNITTEILQNISEILLQYEYKFNYFTIWTILYGISSRVFIESSDIVNVLNFMKVNNYIVPYKLRYIVPFIAMNIHLVDDLQMVEKFTNSVFDLLNKDFDMRYIAALANNEFGRCFKKLPNSIKAIVLKTNVIFLQDEDEDIRNLSVQFFRNATNIVNTPHPYICVRKILTFNFLTKVFSETDRNLTAIKLFCQDLRDALEAFSVCNKIDEYNPFANDSKNIYIEVEVLKTLIQEIEKHFK